MAKLLIIEDNSSDLEIMNIYFNEISEVSIVFDYVTMLKEGIEKINNNYYDIILFQRILIYKLVRIMK